MLFMVASGYDSRYDAALRMVSSFPLG